MDHTLNRMSDNQRDPTVSQPDAAPLLRPFAGLRPAVGQAQAVVAPPYDVLNSDEARKAAAGRPLSFLHISKAEIDLAEGVDPYSAPVYARAAENFARMRNEGVLVADPHPCYYVYQLVMGGHEQNGLVAAASVSAYESGRIRRHELTRPDKEDDRVRQIQALDAQTGPVFLTCREQPQMTRILTEVRTAPPDADVRLSGVQHRLWAIRDGAVIGALDQMLDTLGTLYIADGHHRSAAAGRIAAERRHVDPGYTGHEPWNYFLAVLFPDREMQILDYNRVIRDWGRSSLPEFMQALAQSFSVLPSHVPVKPARKGEFGLYTAGHWWRLAISPRLVGRDPVEALDVRLLDRYCLEPLLGITDPRRDRRIDFVGGIRGLQELERRVDSGQAVLALSLFPTALGELMAVADQNGIMPPKSTWFEPKLADGLVSHLL